MSGTWPVEDVPVRRLSAVALLGAAVWGRSQRWSLCRRCLVCGGVVGLRAPGESIQYCSDRCRDEHAACGG